MSTSTAAVQRQTCLPPSCEHADVFPGVLETAWAFVKAPLRLSTRLVFEQMRVIQSSVTSISLRDGVCLCRCVEAQVWIDDCNNPSLRL